MNQLIQDLYALTGSDDYLITTNGTTSSTGRAAGRVLYAHRELLPPTLSALVWQSGGGPGDGDEAIGKTADYLARHGHNIYGTHANPVKVLADALKAAQAGNTPPITGMARLTYNAGTRTVTLDAKTFPLTERQFEYLERLYRLQGGWFSPEPETSFARPDRIRKALPGPLRDIVESKPGHGTRLNL